MPDREDVADHFECLRCMAVTPVVETPAKCGQCGGGAGVIVSKRPAKASKNAGENIGKKSSDDTAKPD
jgi:hypothetical protein